MRSVILAVIVTLALYCAYQSGKRYGAMLGFAVGVEYVQKLEMELAKKATGPKTFFVISSYKDVNDILNAGDIMNFEKGGTWN